MDWQLRSRLLNATVGVRYFLCLLLLVTRLRSREVSSIGVKTHRLPMSRLCRTRRSGQFRGWQARQRAFCFTVALGTSQLCLVDARLVGHGQHSICPVTQLGLSGVRRCGAGEHGPRADPGAAARRCPRSGCWRGRAGRAPLLATVCCYGVLATVCYGPDSRVVPAASRPSRSGWWRGRAWRASSSRAPSAPSSGSRSAA